jgi:hypothetical protein
MGSRTVRGEADRRPPSFCRDAQRFILPIDINAVRERPDRIREEDNVVSQHNDHYRQDKFRYERERRDASRYSTASAITGPKHSEYAATQSGGRSDPLPKRMYVGSTLGLYSRVVDPNYLGPVVRGVFLHGERGEPPLFGCLTSTRPEGAERKVIK